MGKWITLHRNTNTEKELIVSLENIIALYECPTGGTEIVLSNGTYYVVKEDFTEVKAEMFI